MAAPNVFGGGNGTVNGYTAHYVGSAGSDTYANATNSATPCSLATALTDAAAGDAVFVMDDGAYAIGTSPALLDFTNVGSAASGWIVSAGIDNQNGANSNGGMPLFAPVTGFSGNFTATNDAGIWWENLEMDGRFNATTVKTNEGLYLGTNSIAWNVISHHHGFSGIIGASSRNQGWHCKCHDNGRDGFANHQNFFCYSLDNTQQGFDPSGNSAVHAFCVSQGNTLSGFDGHGDIAVCLFCTSDTNGNTGIGSTGDHFMIAALSMISNHIVAGDVGVEGGQAKSVINWMNYFYNNTLNVTAGMPNIEADTTNTDPSYAGGDDFTPSAAGAIFELVSNQWNSTMSMAHGGMQPAEPAGGGGGVIRRIPKTVGA